MLPSLGVWLMYHNSMREADSGCRVCLRRINFLSKCFKTAVPPNELLTYIRQALLSRHSFNYACMCARKVCENKVDPAGVVPYKVELSSSKQLRVTA